MGPDEIREALLSNGRTVEPGTATDDVKAPSQAQPLGAYPATRCPTRLQWDVLRPADPAPIPDFYMALADAGVAFEVQVFDELEALGTDVVRIPAEATFSQREQATVEAVAAGATLVLGGGLPVDLDGHRAAHPDVLVRVGDAPADERWRYVPVDVKHHRTTATGRQGMQVVVQELDHIGVPSRDSRPSPVGRNDARTRKDLLQLAHYWRTLEAHGLAPEGEVWAGVLGAERAVAWYRLDDPVWQPARIGAAPRTDASILRIYDAEFAFRLEVAAASRAHQHDPNVGLLVEPVWIDECPTCPWREHCRAMLEARDDVSLLPRVGVELRSALHAFGTPTIASVAALPHGTTVPDAEPVAVGEAIEQARARIGSEAAYRRRGVDWIVVPRADVEVDVDMENVQLGAYLWGTLVTDVAGTGLAPEGYRSSVRWDADADDAGGAAAFLDFWRWFDDLLRRCDDAGASVAAFCWSAAAENRWLRIGAERHGLSRQVEDFIASQRWVDLLRVVARQVVTGYSNGLKDVATLTGFRWRDDDPGGGQSMLWWRTATDRAATAQERAAARRRLLVYNEDDVRATHHVRTWLHDHAERIGPAPAP